MNKLKNHFKLIGGFTLVEMVVVLAIIGILITIVLSSFGKEGGTEALNTSIVSIISILQEAHSNAVSSKDASDYGVRILPNQLVSFENAYGTNNKIYSLSNLVKVSTSTGIGTDIIFSNVNGSSNASGTITVSILSNPSQNSTITIYSTGDIEKK